MEYNPLKLPKALDFHLATKDLDLPRGAKSRIQMALSKMDFSQLKRLIKDLSDMRWDALGKKNYKMAAYCKSVQEFAEKYFESIRRQKKI